MDADEYNDTDEGILRELDAGVRNPSCLAEELGGYSRQYIYTRLQILKTAGNVRSLGHGLYELVELPEHLED